MLIFRSCGLLMTDTLYDKFWFWESHFRFSIHINIIAQRLRALTVKLVKTWFFGIWQSMIHKTNSGKRYAPSNLVFSLTQQSFTSSCILLYTIFGFCIQKLMVNQCQILVYNIFFYLLWRYVNFCGSGIYLTY